MDATILRGDAVLIRNLNHINSWMTQLFPHANSYNRILNSDSVKPPCQAGCGLWGAGSLVTVGGSIVLSALEYRSELLTKRK